MTPDHLQTKLDRLTRYVQQLAEQHNDLERSVRLIEHALVTDVPLESIDPETFQ